MEKNEVKEPEYITSLINNGIDAMGSGRVFTIDCNDDYCVNVPLVKITETLRYISSLKETIKAYEEENTRTYNVADVNFKGEHKESVY